MSRRDPLWRRPHFQPTGARIEFDLYCFSVNSIDLRDGSPVAEPWCPTDRISDEIDIGVYRRETAERLFNSILARPMGRATLRNPDEARELFARCAHLNCIEVKT